MTSSIDRLIADPLAEARTLAGAGKRVIGYVGADVPPELILAADAVPVRLRGIPGAPTPRADRYVEPTFSPESRSIAEQWLNGVYDALDAVVLPRTDDSAQRLYYYICELQRGGKCGGPRPLLYDLPRIERPTSREHAIDSTRRLARELGTRESALPEAVRRVAERRTVLAEIHAARVADEPLTGSIGHRMFRAADQSWSSAFDLELRSALAGAERRPQSPRIVLIGSRPPDERLHAAVETAGANLIEEIGEAAEPWSRIAESAPTLESIAVRCYEASVRGRNLLRSAEEIRKRLYDLRAAAAIVWMIEEDTGIAWELPSLTRAVEQAGIPVLALARQQWDVTPETIEACVRFTRSLEKN